MGKPVNKTLRIAAMSAGEEIGHVSGPIVTFRGNGDPLRSLLVNIEPVQAGSGDPSPDNVRPISGWSAVNVWRTGKNLVDISQFATVYPYYCSFSDGVLSVSANSILYNTGISVDIPAGAIVNYAVEYGTATNVRVRLVYDDDTTTDISVTPYLTQKHVKALRHNWSNTGTFLLKNFQVELAAATPYEPYSGNQYTIQLGQTVYGGTLDVTTGVLTVDRAMVDLGTLTWTKFDTPNQHWRFWAYLNTMAIGTKMLASQYKQITANQSYLGEQGIAQQNSPGGSQVLVSDERYTDATTFKAAMSGVQLVYELATPITIPLTPTQISTLQGANNVWADSGDVDVEYIATGGEGGKLALLLRNRKELLIALRKGLSPAEVGLLGSIPSFGGSISPGAIRPGLNTQEEENEKDDA